jgi:hypothetical protein
MDPLQRVEGAPIGTASQRFGARLGGKHDLPAEASMRNADVTQRIVAQDIGLKKGESVTPAAIERLRNEANAKYERLRDADVDLDPDVDFFHGLHQISMGTRSGMKGGAPDPRVVRLVQQYNKTKGKVSINDAMEEVRRLRFDARKNMGSDKPGTYRLGESQRQIADTIEDLIDRQVSGVAPDVVKDWRAARQQLAKLHLVDDAMKGTELDPGVFAKALARGDPLTGGLKDVAEVASNFPHVMQHGSRLGAKAGMGLLDIGMSIPTAGVWALGRAAGKQHALRPSPRVSSWPMVSGSFQSEASRRERER